MILKPIDETYNCPSGQADADDVLRNIFAYNGVEFLETDQRGAQASPDPYSFIAVNRVLLVRPLRRSVNRYDAVSYDCLLSIVKPTDPSQEVEQTNTNLGQFETITKTFLSKEFSNTLRSYFKCCGFEVGIVQIRPIWDSTTALAAAQSSGVEINLTITI